MAQVPNSLSRWFALRAFPRLERRRSARRPTVELLDDRRLLAANQFAVIGDYGSDSANEAAVANLVKSWSPGYVVTVGDNYYDRGAIDRQVGKYYAQFIGNYRGSYGPGSATNRFFPALGNHDWEDNSARPYFDYFTLPGNERYYDFVQGPVHFFIVDSDSHEPDGITASSRQATWLRNGLAASTAAFQIVVFHHPPFSSGQNTTGMRWPFKQWGADAVLSGHVHNYERLSVDGLTYFINGVGGESISHDTQSAPGSQAFFDDAFGAMRVTVDPAQLTFEFFSVQNGGRLIDRFVLPATGSPPPTGGQLTVNDVSIQEGHSGSRDLVFNVRLSAASTTAVEVDYATLPDSARAGEDYQARSGRLTFAPGTTARSVSVPVLGDTQIEPHERFALRLTSPLGASIGDDQAWGTILDDDATTLPPPPAAGRIYLSLTDGGTARNSDGTSVAFKDADILRLEMSGTGHQFALHFDGSDVGLANSSEDLDAFALLPDGRLLLSTVGSYAVSRDYLRPGTGSGATLSGGGEDVLVFTPAALGNDTSGSWSLFFDGSAQGLSGSAENVDAVALLPDGRLVVSTAGEVSVAGATGKGQDLLAWNPAKGSWARYFQGAAVGLASSDENLDGLSIQPWGDADPVLLLSTRGNFSVPGLSGSDEDVLAFVPTQTGSTTSGSYLPALAFDGSRYGLSSFDLDGLYFASATTAAQLELAPLALADESLLDRPGPPPSSAGQHRRLLTWSAGDGGLEAAAVDHLMAKYLHRRRLRN